MLHAGRWLSGNSNAFKLIRMARRFLTATQISASCHNSEACLTNNKKYKQHSMWFCELSFDKSLTVYPYNGMLMMLMIRLFTYSLAASNDKTMFVTLHFYHARANEFKNSSQTAMHECKHFVAFWACMVVWVEFCLTVHGKKSDKHGYSMYSSLRVLGQSRYVSSCRQIKFSAV